MGEKPCTVILGIDPGFSVTGFGILRYENGRADLLDHGALCMKSKDSLPERLAQFHDFFSAKIKQYNITNLALETPFLGKNAQNFLKLGYLRGILFLIAQHNHLVLHEFSPRQIKLSLTGSGGADKDQVARVVLRLFPRLVKPRYQDITDALAVTMCGLWEHQTKRIGL